MDESTTGLMSLTVVFRLGRMSNLPTVWSNTLVGIVLAGGQLIDPRSTLLILIFSLFYVGGMFLNDAFDQKFDAVERPDRPIPSGEVTSRAVFVSGFSLLLVGLGMVSWVGYGFPNGTGWRPLLGGLFLAGVIIAYDWHHKNNPFSPFLMGLCRMLVYMTAGFSMVSSPPLIIFFAASILLSYLIGLTYIAKQENLKNVKSTWPLVFLAAPLVYGVCYAKDGWGEVLLVLCFAAWMVVPLRLLVRQNPGDIRRAVVCLIAGISLVDAIFLGSVGALYLSTIAIATFLLTLWLQRFALGT